MTYSHWQETGPTPRQHAKSDPLESAITFERYRLSVVSGWPDGEEKLEKVLTISCALKRLESRRGAP
jgi:hypothetical protein